MQEFYFVMNESDLTPILVHDFAIGSKTENT